MMGEINKTDNCTAYATQQLLEQVETP